MVSGAGERFKRKGGTHQRSKILRYWVLAIPAIARKERRSNDHQNEAGEEVLRVDAVMMQRSCNLVCHNLLALCLLSAGGNLCPWFPWALLALFHPSRGFSKGVER